jgi:hypothetical protein
VEEFVPIYAKAFTVNSACASVGLRHSERREFLDLGLGSVLALARCGHGCNRAPMVVAASVLPLLPQVSQLVLGLSLHPVFLFSNSTGIEITRTAGTPRAWGIAQSIESASK